MSDVSISYKGAEIASLDDSGTKTLLTQGKYCEDDIEVAYTKPSGGGGVQTIATGTFTGDGSAAIEIPVGEKMPECDFVFSLWVPSGTEVTPPAVPTNRSYVYVQVLVQKRFQKFDLSTNGTKRPTGQCTYPVVNSEAGTTTNRTPNANIALGAFVRYSVVPSAETINPLVIVKDAAGFTLQLGKNTQYTFLAGVDYNWELIYFGSDPDNDIVEVP